MDEKPSFELSSVVRRSEHRETKRLFMTFSASFYVSNRLQ